jgi:hypothetical protein
VRRAAHTRPDLLGTIDGLTPFLDPTFYLDLLTYFASPPRHGRPVMVDMETAAVAKVAASAASRSSRSAPCPMAAAIRSSPRR